MYEYILSGYNNANQNTFVEGIYRFSGDKIGVIDSKGLKFIDKPKFEKIIFPSGLDNISDVILDYFHEYFSPVKKYFNGKISCEITGGFDTRLIISLLSKDNIDYTLLHYIINPKDLNIAKLISTKEKKKIFICDTKKDSIMNDERQYKFFLYNKGYALFDDFFYIFGLDPKDFNTLIQPAKLGMLCISGDRGEILSQEQWTLNRNRISFNEIIKSLTTLDSTSAKFFINKEEFYNSIFNYKLKLENVINTEQKCINNRQSRILFETLYRRCTRSSFINENTYFISPFSEAKISLSTLQIPIKYKKYRRLTIDLIKKSSKDLANYPFLTHLHTPVASLLDLNEVKLKHSFKENLRGKLPYRLWAYISFYKNKNRQNPYYLKPEFVNNLFNNEIYLYKYFNPQYTRNNEILSRLYSLELLIHKFNLNIG